MWVTYRLLLILATGSKWKRRSTRPAWVARFERRKRLPRSYGKPRWVPFYWKFNFIGWSANNNDVVWKTSAWCIWRFFNEGKTSFKTKAMNIHSEVELQARRFFRSFLLLLLYNRKFVGERFNQVNQCLKRPFSGVSSQLIQLASW